MVIGCNNPPQNKKKVLMFKQGMYKEGKDFLEQLIDATKVSGCTGVLSLTTSLDCKKADLKDPEKIDAQQVRIAVHWWDVRERNPGG